MSDTRRKDGAADGIILPPSYECHPRIGTPITTHRPTREQWMIGHALAGVVQALNAAFVWNADWGEREAVNDDRGYEERVAEIVAGQCDHMAIEDALVVLTRAYELASGEGG